MEKEDKSFQELITEFNGMYKLPVNSKPSLLGIERLKNFKNILMEEVDEADAIIEKYEKFGENMSEENKIDLLTDVSDWLGDMVVYITSESTKHGIDMDRTLQVIMSSNFSKLGLDGKPIYDERGKVLKGPNYWKPEPKISELLKESLKE